MPEVAFVISPRQHPLTRELADTLRYELEVQGVPVTVYAGEFPVARIDTVYVLVGPRDFLECEGPSAPPAERVLRRTVLICDEPAATVARGNGRYLSLLSVAGAVFATDAHAALALHRLGLTAHVLRPGYSTHDDHFDPARARDIDILVYGAHSERREQLLASFVPVLTRYSSVVRLGERDAAGPAAWPLAAAEKWDLLARARVVIHLHSAAGEHLEWGRMRAAMHAGAVFVSEHGDGLGPFVAGEHLLVGAAPSLPYLAEQLLADQDRERRIRLAAHAQLRDWLPYSLSIGVLKAACVDLVGRPLTREWTAGPALGPARLRRHVNATPESGALAAIAEASRREADVLRDSLKETQHELRGLAARVAQLQVDRAVAQGGEQAVAVAFRSAAWTGVRAPRATLVLAARSDPERVVHTLDSIAASQFTRTEVALAAPAAARTVVDVVSQWSARHPEVALLIVTRGGQSGRGVLRNVASAFGRSPYRLILDPGDVLNPAALPPLVGTLAGHPSIALAYPLVLVQDGEPAIANGVLWDPDVLSPEHHLRTPYMVRADTLTRHRGYTTAPEFDELEDYDLQRRLAVAGERAALVPQILATAALIRA